MRYLFCFAGSGAAARVARGWPRDRVIQSELSISFDLVIQPVNVHIVGIQSRFQRRWRQNGVRDNCVLGRFMACFTIR